jgi:hypothetical protein
MSKWRSIALEKLPRFKSIIEEANNPMSLWIELLLHLEREYEFEAPEERVIEEIFAYASWCLRYSAKSKSYDMFTEVIVAFYEHLPVHEKIRRDLRYRVSRDDFNYIGSHWSYLLDEGDDEKLRREFFSPKDKQRKKK